jgi:hypothetical protein
VSKEDLKAPVQVNRQTDSQIETAAGAHFLSTALEDALCDLVQVHGSKYLDTFFKRRMRRHVETHRAATTGPEHHEIMRTEGERMAKAGEKVLRDVIERVKADSTPVK